MKRFISIIVYLVCYLASYAQLSIITQGGYSHRLFSANDSLDDDYQNYQQKKKPGTNFSIEPVWFSENDGFGIKYSRFNNTASGDSIRLSIYESKSISEEVQVQYVGLQYHKLFPFGRSNFNGQLSVGLGMVFYKNTRIEYKHVNYNVSARTYGLDASLYLEYKLCQYLNIFAASSILLSNLDKAEENGIIVNYSPKESLSRIDLNAGLRLNMDFSKVH